MIHVSLDSKDDATIGQTSSAAVGCNLSPETKAPISVSTSGCALVNPRKDGIIPRQALRVHQNAPWLDSLVDDV